MDKYVLIGNNNHPRAKITLKRLFEQSFFTKENCIALTTSHNGCFPDYVRKLEIELLIADSNEKMYNYLKALEFDFLISCGWAFKISSKVLELPRKVAINSHSSYLPDYKGLSAYLHTWANFETYSGNTIHIMDKNLDTGGILAQAKFRTYWWDTPRTLLIRNCEHSPTLILLAIQRYNNGCRGTGGDEKKGRYFYKTSKLQFVKHRLYNLLARLLGLSLWLTKHS